jgi:hypothetical protein
MHNTHTPAPYGYGWTALSLLPSTLGGDKFLVTWEMFRLFSLLSLVLLYGTYILYQRITHQQVSGLTLAAVLLNPLLVIEVISNQHNDLWMMVPAMVSLIILRARKLSGWLIGLSALLLAISISTKLATALVIPLWLGLLAIRFVKLNKWPNLAELAATYWPLAASIVMFLPLLTLRSQQFHPWYLIWVMVWLPLFSRSQTQPGSVAKFLAAFQLVWRDVVLTLSVSSLLRYVPWLWAGGFEGEVLFQQKLVTWVPLIAGVIFLLWKYSRGTKFPH